MLVSATCGDGGVRALTSMRRGCEAGDAVFTPGLFPTPIPLLAVLFLTLVTRGIACGG